MMIKFFNLDYDFNEEQIFLRKQLKEGYILNKTISFIYLFKKTKLKNKDIYIDLVENVTDFDFDNVIYTKKFHEQIQKIYLISDEKRTHTNIDTNLQKKYLLNYKNRTRLSLSLLIAFFISSSSFLLAIPSNNIIQIIYTFFLCLLLLGIIMKNKNYNNVKKATKSYNEKFSLRYLITIDNKSDSKNLESTLTFLGSWKIIHETNTIIQYELLSNVERNLIQDELNVFKYINIIVPTTKLSNSVNVADYFIDD